MRLTGPERRMRNGRARRDLMEQVDADFAATGAATGKLRMEPQVRAAIASVPRHLFVPEAERSLAYIDHALPIGCGQTISQPFMVALMTSLLELRPEHVVLEVGTGSGYQAAVLSLLVKQLYSIEIVEALAATANERLKRLGYDNVEVRTGDGSRGWPKHAPFDAIIVTAAAAEIPPALIEQLKPGGRLVIPVGGEWGQDLQLLRKREDGSVETRSVLAVAFVPLTGESTT